MDHGSLAAVRACSAAPPHNRRAETHAFHERETLSYNSGLGLFFHPKKKSGLHKIINPICATLETDAQGHWCHPEHTVSVRY